MKKLQVPSVSHIDDTFCISIDVESLSCIPRLLRLSSLHGAAGGPLHRFRVIMLVFWGVTGHERKTIGSHKAREENNRKSWDIRKTIGVRMVSPNGTDSLQNCDPVALLHWCHRSGREEHDRYFVGVTRYLSIIFGAFSAWYLNNQLINQSIFTAL